MGIPVPKKKYRRKSPKWGYRNRFTQATRKRIIERDKYCMGCRGKGTQIHHVRGRAQGGRGVFENGMLVCHACHDKLHRNPKMMEGWQRFFEQLYGSDYYKDKWDKE